MHRLQSLTRISNWPFAIKMGVCPALAVLAFIGLAVNSIHGTVSQSRLIRAVVDQDLTQAKQLLQSAKQMQQINGQVYRLTTLRAARDPGLDVDREVASLTAESKQLANQLSAYAAASTNTGVRDELNRLVVAVLLYRDAIDVVGSMLEIDFPSAVELIKPFDGNARKVLASL